MTDVLRRWDVIRSGPGALRIDECAGLALGEAGKDGGKKGKKSRRAGNGSVVRPRSRRLSIVPQ